MQKIWQTSYPPGVPVEINSAQYLSLTEMFNESFAKYPDRKAFACLGKTLTYSETDIYSRNFAAWLQSKGVQKGSRVAIMMPNCLQYPIALVAALRLGAIVVGVNPLYTARELKHQLNDSGAETIIILENFAATLQKCLKDTSIKNIVVATMGDLMGIKGIAVNFVLRHFKKMVPAWQLPNYIRFNDALEIGEKLSFTAMTLKPDDIAFLQYTGGTTGVSKGAMLLHSNVIANILQSEVWLKPAILKRPEMEQMINIAALPLYHIYSLTVCGLLSIRVGALVVLIPNPRDIPGLIKTLRNYRFNSMPAVNTLHNALLNHPNFHKLDFSSLLASNAGGMAVQETVAKRWYELTKSPIIEGYGLSETSPCVTCNPVTAQNYSGTIGLPLPSTEVSIRDEQNNELAVGETGEICIRGPQVMAGYWNQPEETAKVMTSDGFFKSGDIGFMNEQGYVKLVDRKKDMILVSGFNVYPNEVEDVAASHPGINEVAAVGVHDEHSGEVVKLFVVAKDPTLTAQEIIDFCHDRLTGYKRPRIVEFRTELPKTNVGKILRRALRDIH